MNERDMKLALKCRLIAEHTGGIYADSLQAFADLVRADERKACAEICEELRPSKAEYDQRFYDGCTFSAACIRARGNK